MNMDILLLIGRILFALIFIMSGMNHLIKLNPMTQYAQHKKVPAAKAGVIVSGILFLLGGLSVAFGYQVGIGAILLLIALIPITFLMHNFWAASDENEQMNEMSHFLKNLALIGASLIILYFGAGPYSLG
jgi:putative oxidoreductase